MCALRNVEHTLTVAPQSSSALYMRYSCATPTLGVAGNRWRYNHGLCDVRSSVVNHVMLTLLKRLWTPDNRFGSWESTNRQYFEYLKIFVRALRDRWRWSPTCVAGPTLIRRSLQNSSTNSDARPANHNAQTIFFHLVRWTCVITRL